MGFYGSEAERKLDHLYSHRVRVGEGHPEGVVEAVPGTLYVDRTAGLVYVKVSGTGRSGWELS